MKTTGYRHLVPILLLLTCGALFFCAGCDKDSGQTQTKVEFEVDRPYERGPLTVHIRLDKSKISIAETLLLEFEATIDPAYELLMPKVDMILQNFGILDWDNLGDRLDENNNVISTYRYRLEPFLSGVYAVPPFTFEFHDPNSPEKTHELTTEPIEVEVASLLGEDRENLTIADIEDVVAIAAEPSKWWLWPLGAAPLVAIVIGLWLWKRNRKIELVRIFKSAHEIAYARLRSLVDDNLIEADKIKEFYERISNILRRYIEHRFDLHAPERTTEEFLAELRDADSLSPQHKETLEQFLTHCDLVKFAKHEPTTEQIQRTFDLVKEFIEQTKSDQRQIDVTDGTANTNNAATGTA